VVADVIAVLSPQAAFAFIERYYLHVS